MNILVFLTFKPHGSFFRALFLCVTLPPTVTLGQGCCSGQSSDKLYHETTVPSTCHNHYRVRVCNSTSANMQQNNLEDKRCRQFSFGGNMMKILINQEVLLCKYKHVMTYFPALTSVSGQDTSEMLNVTKDVGENVEKVGLKKPSSVLLFPHCARSPHTNLW
ncbi:uncharacterized protein V6R79_025320 [Siganus canaliculatus]